MIRVIMNVELTFHSNASDVDSAVDDARNEVMRCERIGDLQFGAINVDEVISRCRSCDENPPNDCDANMPCDVCLMRAMRAVMIRQAIDHLIAEDERIADVMAWDNAEARDAYASHRQYISVDDAAHDGVSGESACELLRDWAPSLARVMESAGMRP